MMTAKAILLHALLQVRVQIRHIMRKDALWAQYLKQEDLDKLQAARDAVEAISKRIEAIRELRPNKEDAEREV